MRAWRGALVLSCSVRGGAGLPLQPLVHRALARRPQRRPAVPRPRRRRQRLRRRLRLHVRDGEWRGPQARIELWRACAPPCASSRDTRAPAAGALTLRARSSRGRTRPRWWRPTGCATTRAACSSHVSRPRLLSSPPVGQAAASSRNREVWAECDLLACVRTCAGCPTLAGYNLTLGQGLPTGSTVIWTTNVRFDPFDRTGAPQTATSLQQAAADCSGYCLCNGFTNLGQLVTNFTETGVVNRSAAFCTYVKQAPSVCSACAPSVCLTWKSRQRASRPAAAHRDCPCFASALAAPLPGLAAIPTARRRAARARALLPRDLLHTAQARPIRSLGSACSW